MGKTDVCIIAHNIHPFNSFVYTFAKIYAYNRVYEILKKSRIVEFKY